MAATDGGGANNALRMLKVFLICLLAAPVVNSAQGESRYVTDELKINMRTGPSTQHKIIRMLPAGEEVKVRSSDSSSGYSRVETESGVEGWVLSRQLSAQPSSKDRLAEAQGTVVVLEKENNAIAEQLTTLRAEHASTVDERQRLQNENRQLAQELQEIRKTAARTLHIVQENEELKVDVQVLESDMESLKKERDELKDGTARDWFLVGAGVILLGIVVGLILPRVRWRRRTSPWDTF